MSGTRLVLVGGGVRSGKSDFALGLAKALGTRPAFVATAQAWDDEMRARIARHRDERDTSFVTIEEPLDLEEAIERAANEHDVVLVDCLTLWLSNLLCNDIDDERLYSRIDRLVAVARRVSASASASVVLVTNEVGLGIVPDNALSRRFRDAAGTLHRRLATVADEVHFAAMGMVLRLKPGPVEPSVVPSHDD